MENKKLQKTKHSLMNTPDVIRHNFCELLSDKDLTNLIIAFGFKSEESQFYYNRIRNAIQHNIRIVQRFTGRNSFDITTIYLLLCEMKFHVLEYIRDYKMFSFPEYSNVPNNACGASPNFVTEKIMFIFANIFDTVVVVGRRRVHFISGNQIRSILRNAQMNSKTKIIQLKIIGGQFLRKNKDA